MAKSNKSNGNIGSATVKRLEASSFVGRDGDEVHGFRVHGFGRDEWFSRKSAAIAVWLSTQPELIAVLREYSTEQAAPVKAAAKVVAAAPAVDAGMAAQLAALQAMVLQLANGQAPAK